MAEKVDRLTRVNALLKRALAELLEKGLFTPPGVLLSVVAVKASVDLRNATVLVSLYGGTASERGAVLHQLESRRAELQKSLARELKFKHTPVLLFKQDRQLEKAEAVWAILNEMELPSDE